MTAAGSGLLEWRQLSFAELDAHTLYAVLQLRSEVFVVEQACAFQDIDGADHDAVHLLGSADGALQAYARCLQPGAKFSEPSIGRVMTREALRGTGAGHELIERAVACVYLRWGSLPIRIGAQARLERYYRQHGFEAVGERYIEDGIPHIQMLKPAPDGVPECTREEHQKS
ncbi:MAG: GNAT family N-acetyltransferase [Pseudomonadota bacterium]